MTFKSFHTGRPLVITRSGIVHSVHTNNNDTNRANARIAQKAGLLAKYAIPINGLTDEATDVEGTYAMASPVIGEDGKLEKVAILTVEVRTGNLVNIEEYDQLHAVSGRKKNDGRKSRIVIPNGSSDNLRSSRMMISDFLDEINSTHRGILSTDVLNWYGEKRPTKGYWAERARFSQAEMDAEYEQETDIRYSSAEMDERQQELSKAWQDAKDKAKELREKVRSMKPEVDAWTEKLTAAMENGTQDQIMAEYRNDSKEDVLFREKREER